MPDGSQPFIIFLSPGNFTAWHIYSCKKEFIENVVGVGASAQWTRILLRSCTILHHFIIALSVNIYVFVLWCVEACKKPSDWLRRLSFVVSKAHQFYQNVFSLSHTHKHTNTEKAYLLFCPLLFIYSYTFFAPVLPHSLASLFPACYYIFVFKRLYLSLLIYLFLYKHVKNNNKK